MVKFKAPLSRDIGPCVFALAMALCFGIALKWSLELFAISGTLSKAAVVLGSVVYLLTALFCLTRRHTVSRGELYLYCAVSGLMPSIRLFLYVSKNSAQYHFADCAMLGLLMLTIGGILYLLFSAFCDARSSLVVVGVWWVAFWAAHKLLDDLPTISLVVTAVGTLYVSVYCARRFSLDRLTGMVLSAVVCVLFAYNFGNALYQYARIPETSALYAGKKDFHVDSALQHPNVYWFHMDGMMGFDTVESVLHDSQTELRENLTERGFVINPSASLDVGWTAYAIPALASPAIYDGYVEPLFRDMQGLTHIERLSHLDSVSAIYDAYSQLDLFEAFTRAGYTAYCVLFDIARGLESIPNDYLYTSLREQKSQLNLVDLLAEHSILCVYEDALLRTLQERTNVDYDMFHDNDAIFQYVNPDSEFDYGRIQHYDWVLSSMFEDILGFDSAKLVYIQNLIPHFPFWHDENGHFHQVSRIRDVSMYLPQQNYAVKVMIGMIDRIIASDPGAVIVIQSDHGIHYFERSELAEQGYTDEQMLEMSFSTVSAVRIPEQYGSLSGPLDPLDITRYLVNHFVGEGNYAYLFYEEE